MDIAAKFLSLGNAAHGTDDLVTYHKGSNIAPFALRHELLNQHVLLLTLQQLDNRCGGFYGFGQQNADPLGSLHQLDDDRCAANSFNRREHISFVTDKSGLRNADVVPTENLQAAKLVA